MTQGKQGYILNSCCLKGCDFSNCVFFSDMAKDTLKKVYCGVFQEHENYEMNNALHAKLTLS